MAVTDLTNTKWKWNETITTRAFPYVFSINFVSNNISYTSLLIGRIPPSTVTTIRYDDSDVYSDVWEDEAYRIIEISGGDDVTDTSLINWLEDFATQIMPNPKKITKDGADCVVEYAINDSKGRKITDTYATIGDIPDVDQVYDSTSENAQSGLAVAQAIAGIPDSPKGVTELPNQYNRITDLEAGVYKLTYPGEKYLYYNGSTSTTAQYVTAGSAEVILFVSRYYLNTDYWQWWYINGDGQPGLGTLRYGKTSTWNGSVGSKDLNSLLTSVPSTYKEVPNSSYANYSLGYYYSTSIFGTSSYSLKSFNFLYPGQYAFSLGTSSSKIYGAPYVPSNTVRCIMTSYAPYYTSDTTYRPNVTQEIIVYENESERRFKRLWSASTGFGEWTEIPQFEGTDFDWEV